MLLIYIYIKCKSLVSVRLLLLLLLFIQILQQGRIKCIKSDSKKKFQQDLAPAHTAKGTKS